MEHVEALRSEHVHIRDPVFVEKTVRRILADGPSKLQIVADFDRTLSKFTHRGKICSSCHNVLEESHVLPEFYKEKARAIKDHYYAIEIDPSISIEEKYPYMVEWWTKAHELLLQCTMTKDDITKMVKNSTAKLRDGCDWFFDELHKHEIPVLVFSAGVGDILEEVIRQQSNMYSNMKIVSNYMDFDKEGKLIGFQGELIHIFNKNEHAVHQSDYFQNLRHRGNILLMGDSIGDLKMAEGAEEVENVLKIGFLNSKVEESLELYKSHYDVVIVEDESVDVVNSLLRQILENKLILSQNTQEN